MAAVGAGQPKMFKREADAKVVEGRSGDVTEIVEDFEIGTVGCGLLGGNEFDNAPLGDGARLVVGVLTQPDGAVPAGAELVDDAEAAVGPRTESVSEKDGVESAFLVTSGILSIRVIDGIFELVRKTFVVGVEHLDGRYVLVCRMLRSWMSLGCGSGVAVADGRAGG